MSIHVHAIILAAGRGERMRIGFPGIPKALVPVDHTPMIIRLLKTLQSIVPSLHSISIVVRPEERALFKKEMDRYLSSRYVEKIHLVVQEEKHGYGTAAGVQAAVESMDISSDHVYLVLNGDAPLIRTESLQKMIHDEWKEDTELVMGTVFVQDPTGYGRIFRDNVSSSIRILEQKEVDELPEHHPMRNVREINTGVYAVSGALMKRALSIEECPVTGEKKWTDICLRTNSIRVFSGMNEEEAINVNSPLDRNYAEHVVHTRRMEAIQRPLFSLLAKDMRKG
jgi:bifunctional UDP-N-acetylglucosamine pyrophosphorylase/glucosamine-1-phosphate N-acetyltransferase